MKVRSVLLVLAGCMAMLCGCKDDKPKYGAPVNVNILGVTGKANLPTGLKLGLYVSDPVGVENFPLTVAADGSMMSEKELKWAFDQSQSLRFFAYSPYDESYTGQETVTINTPLDQRSEEWMLKGNLLTGVTSGGPKDSFVTLKMKHAMTAMTVSFDNRTGEKIEALTVAGFMTVGSLDLITGTLTATDSVKKITPMRSPDDYNSFSFIYIPQDVTPVFYVTMESGREIAFTYDNYCHQYPGSVIKMQIQIDESTPKINILKLSGVNITQWTTNGAPTFVKTPSYINLRDLRNVEPDEKEDGFFSAYINKVTVTAVDRTAEDVLGVILEDSTCAIHVWTDTDSKLKEGNTIVGPVLGLMYKPDDEEYHISHFYTSYATVGKSDKLPCTEGRFEDLAENIDDWEYRRMLFREVMLESEFRNDRAVFMQDSTRVSVICPGIDIMMAQGVKGDLIGFPVRSGSEVVIMVFDSGQFKSFSKEPADIVLTRDSIFGLYDMTEPDTAIYAMSGPDMQLQYSVRQFSYGRTMQVTDTRNGESYLFLIYDCVDVPIAGHEYRVAFNVQGNTERTGSTITMECVKVTDSGVWLMDTTGKYGLIMAL